MSGLIIEFTNRVLSLPRNSKRAIAILTDISLCILCTWLALCIRLEEFISLKEFNIYAPIISVIIALPLFWTFGLYRTIFRYFNSSIISTVLTSIFIYALLYFLIIGVYGIQGIPRSVGIIQPMLLFFTLISIRLSLKHIFTYNDKRISIKKNVLIYGAGVAGRQLLTTLENSSEFKVIGFLDDNNQIFGQTINGKTIYSSSKLKKLIETKYVFSVFLAMPSIDRVKRNKIIENLNKYKLRVKTLPTISEIVDGQITISDIKDLDIDDLLNRDEVKPNINLLNKNINKKAVLVTGAGGSIGSELCRQVLKCNPRILILVELNEFALYKIYEELKLLKKDSRIISLLMNVQDQKKLETVFETFNVETVYHAAAYKHVPLVEENVCEAIKNNVFSTLAIAEASITKKISNLVLISSDKAVRPTNIMGASKRISELIIQGIYHNFKNINTHFAIVRFGNVLESSGSVIPKFKQQIKSGGPVTLTHPEVTRYFMTLTEAAQLVIQAGAIGKHAEVFVLDMGKSIKILDLIHKMIKLYGFNVKDHNNPNGDIEIKIVGLSPGEKLFEELLIGDNPERSSHKKIFKAQDTFIPFDQLKTDLDKLYTLLQTNKVIEVKEIITKLVSYFDTNSKIVDHIYKEQLNNIK